MKNSNKYAEFQKELTIHNYKKWSPKTEIRIMTECYSRKTQMKKIKTDLEKEGFLVSDPIRSLKRWSQTIVLTTSIRQYNKATEVLERIKSNYNCEYSFIEMSQNNGENISTIKNMFLSRLLERNVEKFNDLHRNGNVALRKGIVFNIELENSMIAESLRGDFEQRISGLKMFKKFKNDIHGKRIILDTKLFRVTLKNINVITETVINFFAMHGINNFGWHTSFLTL